MFLLDPRSCFRQFSGIWNQTLLVSKRQMDKIVLIKWKTKHTRLKCDALIKGDKGYAKQDKYSSLGVQGYSVIT